MLVQIVYFYQSNAGHVVYAAHNRGVVARWQVCDDRRFPSVGRSVAAVYDVADLVSGDDPADYRGLPVIIRGNQSSCAIVQFQGGIGQCTWEYYMEVHRAQDLWHE